jgi:hypothetical protein
METSIKPLPKNLPDHHPRRTIAHIDGPTVIVSELFCRRGCELRAQDLEIDADRVRAVCQSCHQDLFEIRSGGM